jgi:hypothetical protein
VGTNFLFFITFTIIATIIAASVTIKAITPISISNKKIEERNPRKKNIIIV